MPSTKTEAEERKPNAVRRFGDNARLLTVD
jgi:hypothetical protein